MTKLMELPSALALRREYGIFDDFLTLPTLQVATYRAAALSAGTNLAATEIFAPDQAIVITDVAITPDGSSAAIDNADPSVWTLDDGVNTIVAKTYNTAAPFPASGVQADLGALAYVTIPANSRVRLTIANTTTAATPATLVQVTYYAVASYPSDPWTLIVPTRGVPSILAGATGLGGVLSVTPTGSAAAAANDELYLTLRTSPFGYAQDQPLIAECRVKFVEASTNQAYFAFGLMDSVAALAMQNAGAGPKTSFSGAVIWKAPGTNYWQIISSVGAVNTGTKCNPTDSNPTDGVWHTLRIEISPISSTVAEVRYFVDGQQLRPSATPTAVYGVVDQVTFTGSNAMQPFLCIKNGTTSAETLQIDYLAAYQERYATGVSH